MRSMRLRTRLWLGGLAAGGVVAAHGLAFLVVAPNATRRAELLEATGHGAWPLVVSLAMGALVAGLARVAICRSRPAGRPPRSLFRSTVGRLALLQVLGYVGLEGVERLARHGTAELPGLLGEPVVLIGIALTAATAVIGALLLVLFAGLIDRLIDRIRALPTAPRVLEAVGSAQDHTPRPSVALGSITPRGPPLGVR
jgi:hypothetical protein